MGTSNSHEYEPALQSTPPKPEKESKVLTIDPRSPTTDIVRTPIVVDKTPENLLENSVPTLDGPIDPRSPTVGIMRTPLAHIPPMKTEPSLEEVPKIDLDQDLENDTSEESPEDFQDPLLNPLCLTNLSLHDLPISESTRLVPADNDQQENKPAEADKLKKKKKARATQPKELFPAKKTSSGLKDSTRSPLSSRNVDVNSPLKIVQRKQMKDIDLKRTCSQQESSVSRFIVKDKENM